MQKSKISKADWLMLIAISLFTLMATLDGSIINIAIPTISKSLAIDMNQAEWIVSVYTVMICVLLIFFGKLGDLRGKIKIFRFGTIVFIIGSFLCGISNSLITLLISRIVQAVGAAMTMANNYGIITEYFPKQHRGQALGIIGSFVSLGNIAGPALGGLILTRASWHYIFLINIPIGIIAIIMGTTSFPKEKIKKIAYKIDFVGFLLSAITIVCFFLAIFIGQEAGFHQLNVISLFIISLISLAAFIAVELKRKDPLVDLRMFKRLPFSVSLFSAFLVFTGLMFFNILMPFYLQNTLGLKPVEYGTILMAMPIALIIVSPLAGTLSDRIGSNSLTFIGLVVICITQFFYTKLGINTPVWMVILLAFISGVGLGLFQSPNNALVMSSVPKNELGVAGSLNSFARNLGMSLGVSLATTALYVGMSSIVGHRVTSYIDDQPWVFLDGMHISFAISLVIYLIALVITAARLYAKFRQTRAAR
jgi:EmrB/QacA subfamily drug resistance transporter